MLATDKRYYPLLRAALTFPCGSNDRLDVKTVLGSLALADAPDFVDDGIL